MAHMLRTPHTLVTGKWSAGLLATGLMSGLVSGLLMSGCSDSIPPTVLNFSANPQQGAPGDKVSFQWSVRDSHSGKIACKLDANGDGTPELSLEDCNQQSTYDFIFSEAGAYKARLTATDKAGNSRESVLSIIMATPQEVGPGIHYYGPEELIGGSVVLNFSDLKSSESVAVIPLNADSDNATDAVQFSITASGFGAPSSREAAPAAHNTSPAPSATPDPRSVTGERLRQNHLTQLQRNTELARDLVARDLTRPGNTQHSRTEPSAGSFNNCVAPYSTGKECSFYLSTENNDKITAVMQYESTNAYWFVDKNDLSDFTGADFTSLANVFEQTIVPADTRYFGNFSDVDENGKILIVFSALLWDTGVLGYVMPVDLFTDEDVYPEYEIHSNEGDIFYATSPGPVVDSGYATKKDYIDFVMPATMVHELKHLIASGVRISAGNESEDLWIEEGSAQAAQELIELGDSQYYAGPMLGDPQNFNLVYADRPAGTAGSAIYGYSFTFVWRVAEQVGHDQFWKAWTAGPGIGIPNVEKHSGKNFEALMQDWGLTIMFDHTNLLDGFDYESLSLRSGWPSLGYSALKSSEGYARSMAYYVGKGTGGAASVSFTSTSPNPHVMVVRFDGELPYDATTRSGGEISGRLLGPAGKDLHNAYMIACPEDEYCSYLTLISGDGNEPDYVIPALPDGKYEVYAWKDVDSDGDFSVGDLIGYHTEDGGETAALVSAPTRNLDIDVFEYTN